MQLEIAWDDKEANTEYVQAVVTAIDPIVDARFLYEQHELAQQPCYELGAMVCYYGQHYVIFSRRGADWIFMDDGNTSVVGAWPAVIDKCVKGRYQPSVLLYSCRDKSVRSVPRELAS